MAPGHSAPGAAFPLNPAAYLRSAVYAVAVDDDLVLLDVEADAYACLPGGGLAWRGPAETPDAKALLGALVDAGLAGPVAAHSHGVCAPSRPLSRIAPPADGSIRLLDLLRLAHAAADLLIGYRKRPLRDILALVRRGGPAPATLQDDNELRRLCAVFDRGVVWLPISGKCLVRSFVLLRFLQRSGLDAAWVFGVRAWPFAAHCWLQVGETALDDWPERLAVYTPIHAA